MKYFALGSDTIINGNKYLGVAKICNAKSLGELGQLPRMTMLTEIRNNMNEETSGNCSYTTYIHKIVFRHNIESPCCEELS